MTVSEARACLPRILERVLAGGEVTLTRHGHPVAVVIRPDRLRVRRADDALEGTATLTEVLEEAGRSPLRNDAGLSEERAEALLTELRASRSRG